MLLTISMFIILAIIYMIYFRADGGSYENILKIMKGLNSNTFNYLTSHRSALLVDKKKPVFNWSGANPNKPDTLMFFSDCVRFNRPCELKGMAEDWPATSLWKQANNGSEYLAEKFGEDNLGVFTDAASIDKGVATRKFSFRND